MLRKSSSPEAGSDPGWPHCLIFHLFQRFQRCRVSFQRNYEIILFISHRMVDLKFLCSHQACCVCAHPLLEFLVARVCSLFCNAGRSPEISSLRALIVLDFILLQKWFRIGNWGKSTG